MPMYNNPIVVVPWEDSEGMRQRTMLSFKGTIDHRKLRKIICQFCARNFQKVSKEFADALIEANLKTFSKDFHQALEKTPTVLELDKAVEAWIQRIQDKDEPIKDESNPTGQGDIS